MSDDLFEEFEFKPLTEGLGFHKKAEQIKTGIQDTRLGDSLSGRLIPDRPMMQDLSKPIATPAADSMSKLMATLPPMNSMKLDFIEERPTAISRTTKQLATELSQPTPAKNPSGFRQTEFQARLEESFAKAFPQPGVRKARARRS